MAEEESRQVNEDVDDFQHGQSMGRAYRRWKNKKNGEPDDENTQEGEGGDTDQPGQQNDSVQNQNPETNSAEQASPSGQSAEQPTNNVESSQNTSNFTAKNSPEGKTPNSASPMKPGTVASDAKSSAASDIAQESIEGAGKEAGKELGQEGAKQAGKQVGKEVGKEAAQEIGQQTGKAIAKTAGKEAVKEASMQVGKAGIRTAAGALAPESLGTSLLIEIGTEAAIKAGGYIIKHFWIFLLVGMVVCYLLFGGFFYSYIGKMFSLGSMSPDEQKITQELSSMVDEDKLSMEDKQDIEKIKQGVGNIQAIAMMTELGDKLPGITVNYIDSSSASTKKNQPFEFDVTKVGKIKCTDSSTLNKYAEYDISLKSNTNWSSMATSSTAASKIICAPDYYPMIDKPVQGLYWSEYGMTEFTLDQIATSAPNVTNYKQAQVLDAMIDIVKNAEKDLGIKKMAMPNVVTVTESFRKSMPATLYGKLQEAYGDSLLSDIHTFAPTDEVTGIHMSFLS